jgi:hypothetical protein
MAKKKGDNHTKNTRPVSPLNGQPVPNPPWKPGQSGNPKGRPKGKSITTQLRKLMDEGLEGRDLADAMAKAAYKAALKGDHRFWKEIIERLDGKVPDRFADADGNSIPNHVRIEFIKAKDE